MLNFKDYYLLRENEEEIPEDFTRNLRTYIEKLPKELRIPFVIQCVEHVLPKWEEWAEKSNLTSEQQTAPKRAIKAKKNGSYYTSNIADDVYHLAYHIANNMNASIYSRIAYAIAFATYSTPDDFDTIDKSISFSMGAGVPALQVYKIYDKLLKTQGFLHAPTIPDHIKQLTQTVLANLEDKLSREILADALDELEVDSEHRDEWEAMTKHLRDPNVHWASNDWIFKELLGK